jgi:tetrahydromethanopterin S-methyltransferase subunit A
MVREAVKCGGALAGTLQTANTGIEKIVANIVANPNIRYLVICGRDAGGHMPRGTLRCLVNKGLDSDRGRVKTGALRPNLLNIPMEAIHRFVRQIAIVDLTGVEDTDNVKKAVWATRRNQQCSETIMSMILEHILSLRYARESSGESPDST